MILYILCHYWMDDCAPSYLTLSALNKHVEVLEGSNLCVFFQKDTQNDAWNLIPEFHHPSMDVMSWLNPVGPMDSEVRKMRRCRSFTPCTDRPLETNDWVGGWEILLNKGGGCCRSRMTWVSGPKWNDHKVLDTPKWLKGWRSTSNGVLTILDNPHIFTLVFVKCVGTRESCPVSSVAWFYLWGPEPVQGPWPWQWCLSINVHVEFAIVSVNSDLLFCVFWRL